MGRAVATALAAVLFALTVPANVCPLEISVINQQMPWKVPVIPYSQEHPK